MALGGLLLAACSSGSSGPVPADAEADRTLVDAHSRLHDAGHDGKNLGTDAPDARRKTGDGTDARGRDAGRDAGKPTPDAGRDARERTDASAAGDAAPDAREATDARDAARDARKATDASDAGDAARDAREAGDAGDAAADPTLTTLEVSPLTLTPAFSPAIHDYYVRCVAGDNPLSVTVEASTGATTSITQPVPSGPAPRQTVALHMLENEAVVVDAVQGSTTNAYWVRCLPHDFPQLSMVLHPEAGTPPPGYYLVGTQGTPSTESGYAVVLDVQGAPVWYGRTANAGDCKDVELIDSNTISYIARFGSAEIHTLDPVGVTYLTTVGMVLNTHEFRKLPNGDFIMFAAPVTRNVDLTGLQGFGANETMVDCVIQQLHPNGELVWEWRASDHFDPVTESTDPALLPTEGDAGTTIPAVDVFHCNSIDWDSNGDLLVSMRDLDAVSLVSHKTKKVIWKMGGTTYNKDGAAHITVTGDPLGGFFRQHDARFQHGGTVSMYDDQTGKPGPSRGLLLSYDVDAGTAAVAWQYQGTGPVFSQGSLTILADGSHVIGWGAGVPAFTEVTLDGGDLLDFTFPDGDQTYRAIKVPASSISLDLLRSSVGPWSSSTGIPDAGVSD